MFRKLPQMMNLCVQAKKESAIISVIQLNDYQKEIKIMLIHYSNKLRLKKITKSTWISILETKGIK